MILYICNVAGKTQRGQVINSHQVDQGFRCAPSHPGEKQMVMFRHDEVEMTETNKTNPNRCQNTLSHDFTHLGFKAEAAKEAVGGSAAAKPGAASQSANRERRRRCIIGRKKR